MKCIYSNKRAYTDIGHITICHNLPKLSNHSFYKLSGII